MIGSLEEGELDQALELPTEDPWRNGFSPRDSGEEFFPNFAVSSWPMLEIPQNSELIFAVDDPLNSINRTIKSLETFSGLPAHPHVLLQCPRR